MDRKLEPTGALVEILKASGEWDDLVGGKGLRFQKAQGPPPPPPPPQFMIPAFDTSSFVEPVQPEPAPVATEENPGPPPRREPIDTGRIASATPRLDEARAWMSSQMRGDRP